MDTVYVVICDEVDIPYVVGVYSSLEKAEDRVNRKPAYKYYFSIETHAVDDPNP